MRARWVLACVLALLALLAAGPGAAALEYRDPAWGFDGRVVPDAFNLLTVAVHNPGKRPFDGVVRLEQAQGFGKVGGTLVSPCYLEPGTSRVLQFYPRISGNHGWRLSDGSDKLELDPPKEGPPGVVRIVDGEDPLLRTSAFKTFPHQQFPTTVSGTEALRAAVVDYLPAFAPSQKSAFADWILGGGTLHVFPDASGKFPDFGEPLSLPGEATAPGPGEVRVVPVGNGMIHWHGRALDNLAAGEAAAIMPPPAPEGDGYRAPIDMALFQQLQRLTRLDVAWPLVYLAALAYIGLLGPGHYFWGKKKKRDYRVVLVVLLASVALFSGIFAFIGRRGYDEQTQLSTVSLARHIEGDRHDVTTWGNLFVTSGDDYELRHPSPHNLYSTGEAYESVDATIANGRDGFMQTEIPVFSGRTFVHRGTLQGMPRPERVRDTGSGAAREIEWKLPDGVDAGEAWVRTPGGVIRARVSPSGTIIFSGAAGAYVAEEWHAADSDSDSGESGLLLSAAGRLLLHQKLGLLEYQQPGHVPELNQASLELYVLAPSPDSFRLADKRLPIQRGVTLYRFRYQEQNTE